MALHCLNDIQNQRVCVSMERAPLFNLCMCTRRLRMGEKSYSFSKIQKNRKKKVFPDGLYREKISRAGVSYYLPCLLLLEGIGHLQPVAGSGTGPPVSSSL